MSAVTLDMLYQQFVARREARAISLWKPGEEKSFYKGLAYRTRTVDVETWAKRDPAKMRTSPDDIRRYTAVVQSARLFVMARDRGLPAAMLWKLQET